MFDDLGKVLITASANPQIGLRRVRRAYSVARSLRSFASSVHFLDHTLPGRLKDSMQKDGIETLHEDGVLRYEGKLGEECYRFDLFAFRELLDQQQPNWLVNDGVWLDPAAQKLLDSRGVRVLEIERVDGSGACACLEVAPWSAKYDASQKSTVVEILSGPDFVPTGRLEESSQPRQIPARVKRIVIWVDRGASVRLVQQLLEAVSAANLPNCSIDLVLAANCDKNESLMQSTRECRSSVRVHRNADRGLSLFPQADLALVGPGAVFAEAAALGVPTLLIGQSTDMPYWLDLKTDPPCVYVESSERQEQLVAEVRRVARSKELRLKLSAAGMRLVDGGGADRIARSVAVYDFDFRRADAEDANLLHTWRNDPETRAMSFDGGPISFEEHADWMDEMIRSEQAEIYMIENRRGQSVGTCRLKFGLDDHSADISLLLVPALRGRGLGAGLIEKVCRAITRGRMIAEFTAYIRPNHQMAQAAFVNAGFEVTAPVQINGQVATCLRYKPKLQPLVQPQHRRKAS